MRQLTNQVSKRSEDRVVTFLSVFSLFAVFGIILLFPNDALPDIGQLRPIPDRLVVLTFDDGPKSNATFVAPLLKRYAFGATFYITEFYDFRDNCPKEHYMTWEEIRKLHEAGFEIGNHTRTHRGVGQPEADFREDVEYIERRCEEYGIPKPKTFCYTSYRSNRMALKVLKEKGYLFARRGFTPEFVYNEEGSRGLIYDPKQDHPLLIPTTGASGPAWSFDDFLWAVKQARDGKIAILTFHGVPDLDHPWVNTEPAFFKTCMDYLHENDYTVIAMRDLAKYVDPTKGPSDPYAPIQQRLRITPTQLRCEYAVNPLGLDTEEPRFSWLLESSQRGQMQSAYQIIVASSEEKLNENKGDLWDSGKVTSEKSVNVVYKGSKLSSSQKCYWKVRCWDKDGKSSQWSETAIFEMGLLKDSDWKGRWIGAKDEISAPLLRKEFEISKKVKRARVYISGIGWNELYINGCKVGDHVLDPAMTDYEVRILYATYDITDMLKTGSNAIGVMLGNGWYCEPRRLKYGDSPRLLMQMNIEFTDGTSMSVKSDDTWKTSSGPITHNSIRYGEIYDARLEKPGWAKVGYDDSGWDPAVIKQSPAGRMESQLMPAIKVTQTIKPVKLTNPKPGIYVYDMGQLFGGWVRLRVKGPRGTKVAIKYSGRISKDSGLVNKRNYRAPKETDYYILKGDSRGEIYEPRFTFHPVRYVQIEGYPGVPTIDDLQGRVVHSAIDLSGHFQCSNELINQIYRMTFWTVKNALYGMPLDCLGREWWAYLEPAETPANLYNRKYMPLFWTKFLNDVKYAQLENGDIPVVVPNYTNYTSSDTAWSGNYPIAVWYVYQYYDDERILREHYPSMRKWLDYLSSLAEDHLINKGQLGDHMLPGPKPGEEEYISSETPPALCWSGTYYRNASIVSQAADILGKANDAERYARLAEDIKDAFNRKWLNRQTNNYATGSQTSNLLPLALGIVPKDNEEAVVKNIVQDITDNYDGHLHTGIIGTTSLMEALTEHSQGDVMYGIVTKTTYPSWGYMIAQGATTIWESWGRQMKKARCRADSMAMFATINEFFYTDLAGIKGPDYYGPGFMAPGFREICIKPHILGDLRNASASIKTVRGMVSSSWKREGNSLTLKVIIPVNSCAKVSVPKMDLKGIAITESGKLVWKKGKFVKAVPGITAGREAGDYVTFDVGSGYYFFRLVGQ